MDKHERDKIHKRMDELVKPIDRQIMLTDDANEVLLLATAMLQRSMIILDNQYGKNGRNAILKDLMKK